MHVLKHNLTSQIETDKLQSSYTVIYSLRLDFDPIQMDTKGAVKKTVR